MCGAPDQAVALPPGTDLTKETVLTGRVVAGGEPVGGAFVASPRRGRPGPDRANSRKSDMAAPAVIGPRVVRERAVRMQSPCGPPCVRQRPVTGA